MSSQVKEEMELEAYLVPFHPKMYETKINE